MRRLLILVCTLSLLLAVFTVSALAQDDAVTVTAEATQSQGEESAQPTQTPQVVFVAASDEDTKSIYQKLDERREDGLATILIALGVGLVTLGLYWLYRYLDRSRTEYYDLARYLGSKGIASKPVVVTQVGSSDSIFQSEDAGASCPQVEFKVPSSLVVGEPSQLIATGVPTDKEIKWQLADASLASISPDTGSSVQITALKEGTIKITAVVDPAGANCTYPMITLNAEEAVKTTVGATELPFIGQGALPIYAALILAALVFLLRMLGGLDTALTATILASIAGFLFGTTARR